MAGPFPGNVEPRFSPVWTGLPGARLLSAGPDGYEGLARVRALGGEWLLQEIEASGLRGGGGAAFPTIRKWRAVSERRGPRVVVGNGEEGEPPSWKDRFLMRQRPWWVVEGIALAMETVGASRGYLYLSDEASAVSIRRELEAASDVIGLDIAVVTVPRTYVAGEETAAVRFLSGGPPLPTSKPPRPFESGVRGQPTLVNNVETLAHVAWLARFGAQEYRGVGTEASPGTFLACVSGAVASPFLIEAPFGTPLSDIVEAAHPTEDLHGILLGGYFSGFLPAELMSTPASNEALSPYRCGLGNGAIVAVGASTCPVRVVGDLLAFFADQSAGQCGPCVRGTAAMRDILVALRNGQASADDLARLAHYGETLQGRGACQLLDGAALTAVRALNLFAPALEAHLLHPCGICRSAPEPDATGHYSIGDEVFAPSAA